MKTRVTTNQLSKIIKKSSHKRKKRTKKKFKMSVNTHISVG